MDIRVLAWWLLLGRIVSTGFILLVISRQIGLFRRRIQPELIWFRRVLFGLALVILIGNMIPLMIDVVTIIGFVERSTNRVNPVGVAYALSNDGVAVFSAILVWIMYRMAARTLLIVEREKDIALEEKIGN